MPNAIQGLRDAIKAAQEGPQQDALKIQAAQLQAKEADLNKRELGLQRSAGVGAPDRLAAATENRTNTQNQVVDQAKSDALARSNAERSSS